MGSIYSCVMKNCRYVTNTVGINNLNEEMGKRGSNNAIDVKRQLQNGVEPHCYIPAIKRTKAK